MGGRGRGGRPFDAFFLSSFAASYEHLPVPKAIRSFQVFLPPAPLLAGAHVSGLQSYREKYRSSINDSDAFWRSVAEELHFAEGSSKVPISAPGCLLF